MVLHLHVQPHDRDEAWRCRACPERWPCGPVRRRLLELYADARECLRLYLREQYAAASLDLPDMPAGLLRAQIVGWAEPHTRPPGNRGAFERDPTRPPHPS